MKPSIWDLLSIIFILGVIFVALFAGLIISNPNTPLNPFPPATPLPTLFIPSSTPTSIVLPPTWTSTPAEISNVETQTLRFTSTPIPTRTPFVLPSPTKIPAVVMPTNARIPLEGRCKVVEQEPKDGTRLKFGDQFRASWTLQNSSDAAWDSGSTDVRFKEGEAMHTGPSLIDLPTSVPAGNTTLITITMKVPAKTGYHITYWTIVSGSKTLCTFYIEIFADK